MITLFAALSAGAKTYLRCNFSIFFFSDLTERLDGCLYKCGCSVKLSILMSMIRKNSCFQSLRECTQIIYIFNTRHKSFIFLLMYIKCTLYLIIGPDSYSNERPRTVDLMRFAKLWCEAKDKYRVFAAELGLYEAETNRIEHDYVDDLAMKVFSIAHSWFMRAQKTQITFNTLLKAAQLDTGHYRHILCQVSQMQNQMFCNS